MIQLYQFPTRWGVPNESPFCMKMETYLRMSSLDFEIVYSLNLRRAPKGKMPYIEDRGKKIGDSNWIAAYLKAQYQVDLDQNLSEPEQAVSLAMRRLIEENLYWCIVHSRWNTSAGWKLIEPLFFGFLPPLIRTAVGNYIRRGLVKETYYHGMGRHSEAEIFQIGRQDIRALATFLGKKKFFMGEEPTSLDAAAYGFLGNILQVPLQDPLQEEVRSQRNVVEYCRRIQEKFFKQTASLPR
ncbi:MAG TPA: glutathione S-transferase [Deltaproteobacteria bacterium]|nr:glutathione S-transferase [Deltaproteobacteria bacterium]